MKDKVIGTALILALGLIIFYAVSPQFQTFVSGFVTDMVGTKKSL